MTKIIHAADIHLGSKMEAKFPREKSDERKAEVRRSFDRMIGFAKEENIRIILLSGDVFDSDRPSKRDKEFFYNAVKNNPGIDFLYLRGNHDILESYTETDIPNLKTFSSEWTYYTYRDICIAGAELSEKNCSAIYPALKLDPAQINIVMLHGQTDDRCGADAVYLPGLKGKNIDYLALGHIHSYVQRQLDDRGIYAYSGCLEGRGFDETGQKGFVLIEIEDKKTHIRFIPHSYRTIFKLSADLSDTEDAYSACKKAAETYTGGKNDIVRLELRGEIPFDNDGLSADIEKELESKCYFASVKDLTARKFDINKLKGDISLRGEFIRGVYSNPEYDEQYKSRIIALGLRALSGREAE